MIRQYKAYMKDQGKEHLQMSDSRMHRILNELPATKSHNMSCFDTLKVVDYEVFIFRLKGPVCTIFLSKYLQSQIFDKNR